MIYEIATNNPDYPLPNKAIYPTEFQKSVPDDYLFHICNQI